MHKKATLSILALIFIPALAYALLPPPALSRAAILPETSHTSEHAKEPASPALSPFSGQSIESVIAALKAQSFTRAAPQEWGEHLAGVTSHLSHAWQGKMYHTAQRFGAVAQGTAKPVPGAKATVALTFDACGGGKGAAYDAKLIEFLREHHIPATFFVTTRWIKKNPETLVNLAQDPLFEIAAHGTAHKPLSINGKEIYSIKGTNGVPEIVAEVEANAREIEARTGFRPRWFRSGTAYYDDVAVAIIRELGLGIAGYSITADEGATLKAPRVAAKMLAAKDGDILLFHMNHPESGTAEGVKAALPQLVEQGFAFVKLSDL